MDKHLEQSEDELYAIIGESLVRGQHATGIPKKDLVELGRQWFHSNIKDIKECVCSSQAAEAIRAEKDPVKLLPLLADLIAAVAGSIPVFTLAALVLKIGIDKFCRS